MTIAQARTILGLPENFTTSDLKSQYRKKVLIAHPDRNGGDDKRFIIVQRAFELLTKFKDNSSIYHPNNRHNPTKVNDIYQRRRQAEQAYKEKVHYYTRKKKSKQEINKQIINDFKVNVKYFFMAIMLIIGFLLSLILSAIFGPIGIIIFLIFLITMIYRYHYSK